MINQELIKEQVLVFQGRTRKQVILATKKVLIEQL